MTEKQSYQNDEIDLFDLFDDIKAQWHWVFGVATLVAATGLLYALLATPMFKTESELVAVSSQDLISVNLAKARLAKASDINDYKQSRSKQGTLVTRSPLKIDVLNANELFDSLAVLVNSNEQKLAFYQTLIKDKNSEVYPLIYNESLNKEDNIEEFLERFSARFERVKNLEKIKFSIDFTIKSAKQSAQLLNQYIDFVVGQHKKNYKRAFELELKNTLENIKELKESALQTYRFEKTQRIATLKEAIAIAEKIGQKKPFYNINQVVTGSEPPLYMMGELALKEELKQLNNRKDSSVDESVYIKGFSLLNEKQVSLEALILDWDEISLARIDSRATPPRAPFKPKKALIVAMAGMAGLMLGVMLALLVAASKRRAQANKDKKEAEKA